MSDELERKLARVQSIQVRYYAEQIRRRNAQEEMAEIAAKGYSDITREDRARALAIRITLRECEREMARLVREAQEIQAWARAENLRHDRRHGLVRDAGGDGGVSLWETTEEEAA